jgi:hypothetical protein
VTLHGSAVRTSITRARVLEGLAQPAAVLVALVAVLASTGSARSQLSWPCAATAPGKAAGLAVPQSSSAAWKRGHAGIRSWSRVCRSRVRTCREIELPSPR